MLMGGLFLIKTNIWVRISSRRLNKTHLMAKCDSSIHYEFILKFYCRSIVFILTFHVF